MNENYEFVRDRALTYGFGIWRFENYSRTLGGAFIVYFPIRQFFERVRAGLGAISLVAADRGTSVAILIFLHGNSRRLKSRV